MNIVVEADPQLAGRVGQRHEGIPGLRALQRAGTEADVAFAHALPCPQLRRVVVERYLGMREDQQQAVLFGPCLANPVVQRPVVRLRRKQAIKRGGQPHPFGLARLVPVDQQLGVEIPELRQKVGQRDSFVADVLCK